MGTECKLIDAELDQRFGEACRGLSHDSRSELSLQARIHLEECERCRRLYRWISSDESYSGDSPELYSKIARTLRASLTPLTPLPGTKALVLQFLALFAVITLATSAMMGFGGIYSMAPLEFAGITLILAAGATAVSFSLAWQMRPGSLQRFSWLFTIAGVAASYFAFIGAVFPWRPSSALVAEGWPCSVEGAVIAVLAALLFWAVIRRGAPLSMPALGGALGTVAALLAITVLQFSCARQEATHLLLFHGSVLMFLAFIGILVAHVFDRFKPQRP
jgi:hypothetical protein